jgi:hypothetical protein
VNLDLGRDEEQCFVPVKIPETKRHDIPNVKRHDGFLGSWFVGVFPGIHGNIFFIETHESQLEQIPVSMKANYREI